MHRLLALLRHIHREIVLLGLGVIPVVYNKYATQCAILIGLLCAALALYDLAGRRWVQAVLWIVTSALLAGGFRAASMLWSPRIEIALGGAAIATALLAVLLTLREMLGYALERARYERHQLRRVPGAPAHHGPGEARPPRHRP